MRVFRPFHGAGLIVRCRLKFIAVLMLAIAVQGCSQFGGSGKRGGGDRGLGQDRDVQRPLELSRMSANDQIRLRLTDARVALHLTAAQTFAWQTYENKVIEMLSSVGREAVETGGGNAMTQIDRQVATEQRYAATLEQLTGYARQLYAVLDDEQKRTADRLLPGTVPTQGLEAAPVSRGGR